MLRQNRHPNLDLFVADLWAWPVKDDQASMEHPFFSLAKKPDLTVRHYEHNGNTLTIAPSVYGMPTIWDKDILIYCCSQLIEGMRRGREPKQVIGLTAYDFLVSTNRTTGKRGYDLLTMALNRLRGVSVTTNIATGGQRIRKGFGLLEWWEIIEKSPTNDRMVGMEVKLSDWLYRAVLNHEVLTLSRDYFRLDSGIERRLYELARKHCGTQKRWAIHLETLHKKMGSHSPLRHFRYLVTALVASNHLPDYRLAYERQGDQLTVFPR